MQLHQLNEKEKYFENSVKLLHQVVFKDEKKSRMLDFRDTIWKKLEKNFLWENQKITGYHQFI